MYKPSFSIAAACVALIGVNVAPVVAQARDTTAAVPDTNPVRTFGGFVDTYYAWDFNRPYNFDRAYTTQPARHAEANVNLAYIETKWSGPRYRGRLALQWGTAVQSNYSAEPRIGGISGPSLSQFLQEATVGYQLGQSLWLDVGIFFSHIGYEGWISRDNVAYSRSLVADYSPYYESGAKLTWAATPKLTTTFVLVNGWQNISNYNTPPGGGVRLDYVINSRLTVSYDNFVGNMAPDSETVRLRLYHDVIAQYTPSSRWLVAAQYSLGTQSASTPTGGTASWWGMTTFAKYHVTPTLAVVGRVEAYSDPSQIIIATGQPVGFRTAGASIGVDVKLKAPVLWRTEFRGFQSDHAVWPLHTAGATARGDAFFTSSLALTF